MRTRLHLATVAVVAALITAACASATTGPPAGSPTTPPASTTTPATTGAATAPPGTPNATSLVPLRPFTTAAQVASWQAAYRASGQQPWHLDAGKTALSFARDHLRYVEIDRVTTRSVAGGDARIGVGWNDDNGTAHTAAVLHLIRFGSGDAAPWVVVGSDDTDLTLTIPRYGATVTSPLTVGGRITGVDESLHVKVLGPASAVPLAEVTGLPAGGENTPWTTTLRFTAPRGTVLTVAVSTGGHIMDVERFAITAARMG
jgi:hypothetical protein